MLIMRMPEPRISARPRRVPVGGTDTEVKGGDHPSDFPPATCSATAEPEGGRGLLFFNNEPFTARLARVSVSAAEADCEPRPQAPGAAGGRPPGWPDIFRELRLFHLVPCC